MRVLVVHDDDVMRARARQYLVAARHEVADSATADAPQRFDAFQPEVVVCNLGQPTRADIGALHALYVRNPRIGFVGMTSAGQPKDPGLLVTPA
jgi:DNA-binding NarL/FixJ family response regulator